MASWMPWRLERKALGTRYFGSAVSDDVSDDEWMHSTPRSRTTSCTAKDPALDSASSSISQPSLLTSSRATRAASCGWLLLSRYTIAMGRPANPPAALIRSTSISMALRWVMPDCAIGPENVACMPMRTALAWAPAMCGVARGEAKVAAAPASTARRVCVDLVMTEPRSDIAVLLLPLGFEFGDLAPVGRLDTGDVGR